MRKHPSYAARPRSTDRQIPIGLRLAARASPTRGFLPWRLSDAGPPACIHTRVRAGIRNPSQERPFLKQATNASVRPKPDLRVAYCEISLSISRTIAMKALAAGESVRPRLVMKP